MNRKNIIFIIVLVGIGIVFGIKNIIGDLVSNNKIGVLDIDYAIMDSKDAIEDIDYLVGNGVKALIIRVNSPGGGVAASQEIYQHIARVKEENNILIVSAFSAVAASGGYYVALDSDFIFANPGSVVGSIGVIMSYPILEEMLGYIGINQETIKSSEYKDTGSPYRKLNESEEEYLQELVDDMYNQFVGAVSKHRKINKDVIMNKFKGKVFTGLQAKENGLIDSVGSYVDALEYVKTKLSISSENIIYAKEEDNGLFDFIFNNLSNKLEYSNFNNYKVPSYLWQ